MQQYFLKKRQWLVGRESTMLSSYPGLKSRIVISRAFCIYYFFDFANIPKQKKNKVLENKIKLSSPFENYGFYVEWQKSIAQVWLWDNDALLKRVPEEARSFVVVPDSVLAGPASAGQRVLKGIDGFDIQCWSDGHLKDSRWSTESSDSVEKVNFSTASINKELNASWLMDMLGAFLLFSLLWWLLLQTGMLMNLTANSNEKVHLLEQADNAVMVQQQAKSRALELRARLNARDKLFPREQSVFIPELVKKMPETVSLWQRYDYRAEHLELLIIDSEPDPRAYVRQLNGVEGLSNVQVQLDPNNQRIRLIGELDQE